jgi:hypothetical protein
MKAILLSFLLALAAIQNPVALGTGTIEGRVLRAGTGEPVANMPITLIESSGISEEASASMLEQIANLVTIGLQSASQAGTNTAVTNLIRDAGPGVSEPVSILTDRSGHFEFPNMRKGRYTVWVQRQGYFGPSFNGVPASVSARTINFDPAQPTPVDVVVIQNAVISGRVIDPRGRPISGAGVTAYRPTYNEGRLVWTQVQSLGTNDLGEYRIVWLPPGDYYLSATPPPFSSPVPGSQESMVRTFYPGAIDPSQARKVTADSGETRGIDISIQTAPSTSFKISGVAVNPNSTTGDRAFGSFVLVPREYSPLYSTDLPFLPNQSPGADRQNGEFEIRNVRPGMYDLFPISFVSGFLAGRTFVNVSNADAQGVRVALNPAVNLQGTVVVNGTGAKSFPLESIQIGLRGLSIPSIRGAPLNNSAFPVDAAGKFTAVGLSGERAFVRVSGLPDTAFVSDIRQGELSVFDSGLEITGSAEPLRVIVDAAGSTLEGIVRNPQGQPESRVTVVLVPAVERRQNASLYKTRLTNDAGRFEIRGIAPGTYTVFAWKSVPPTAWQNAEFLSSNLDRGHVINIAPASRATLELEAIP